MIETVAVADLACLTTQVPAAKFQRLEARISVLESAVIDIKDGLKAIRLELGEFRGEMRGRLSNLPTSFQLVFMLATFVVAAFVGATGLSLAILKLTH